MRSDFARTVAFLVLIMISGCDQKIPITEPTELQTGYWQARITLPGGDIITGFEIQRDRENYRATLINGQERVKIDEVNFSNGQLLLRFPAFNNEINARLKNDKLIGILTLVKRYGKTQLMPFIAIPGSERTDKFTCKVPSIDLSGRWAAQFHNENGSSNRSIGEFTQRGSDVFGTFLTPTADHRFLSGYVCDNKFHLATFDGAQAIIFAGEGKNGEIINANFWSGTEFHQTWSAVPDPDATLPDAYKLTYLNPGYDRFNFEFPNLDGQLVSLTNKKFDGKVIIVTIAGTWCPNCHDEAKLLASLYKFYHNQGLEVIALMYEHFEDQEIAKEQIRRFRRKFDIQYETLIAGISDKTEVSMTLPSLNFVSAFPTTIFIDRSGMVRVIHTGFSGPGTGRHYDQLKKEITDLIVELIGETADLAESHRPDAQKT